MCDPTGISETALVSEVAGEGATAGFFGLSGWQAAQMGLSAGVGLMQYMSQSEAQSRMNDSAKANYEAQMAALHTQQEQINEQASDQMSARAKQTQFKMAQLRASAGEAGISGITEDSMEREVAFNSSSDIASIENNRSAKIKQSMNQGAGVQSQTQSQINSVATPSLLGAGLQIAGTYMDQQSKMPNNRNAGVQYNKGS